MPNELPLNWCECKLVDTCDVYQPKTISTKELIEDGKYTVYGANGIIGRYNQYNHENSEILITCRGATCGTINKSKPFSWINGNAMVVHPFIKISSDFLFYYLNSVNFKPYISGSAQSQITRISLQPLSLPLPPSAEQERIVEKIEALFAGIDEGVERLKSAQAQIKQYRQSVLKSAFEGKLYKTTEWKEKKLIDLTSKIGSGSTPNGGKNNYHTDGIPIIRSMNVHMSKFIYEGLAYLDDKQASQLNNVITQKDDVLLNITGASIGRTCLLPDTLVGARVNQHVSIVRTKNELLPQYLSFYFASPIMQTKITIENYGATRQALTKSAIENFRIHLPTLPEQQRIVEEIEKRFAVADELEKAVNEGLEKADKLKQSILKKAFEGKLVAQNPNDEPASVLLERIKKINQPQTKGRKK